MDTSMYSFIQRYVPEKSDYGAVGGGGSLPPPTTLGSKSDVPIGTTTESRKAYPSITGDISITNAVGSLFKNGNDQDLSDTLSMLPDDYYQAVVISSTTYGGQVEVLVDLPDSFLVTSAAYAGGFPNISEMLGLYEGNSDGDYFYPSLGTDALQVTNKPCFKPGNGEYAATTVLADSSITEISGWFITGPSLPVSSSALFGARQGDNRFYLQRTPAGVLNLGLGDAFYLTPTPLENDTVYHFDLRLSGNNYLLYINEEEIITGAWSGSIDTIYNFFIGGNNQNGTVSSSGDMRQWGMFFMRSGVAEALFPCEDDNVGGNLAVLRDVIGGTEATITDATDVWVERPITTSPSYRLAYGYTYDKDGSGGYTMADPDNLGYDAAGDPLDVQPDTVGILTGGMSAVYPSETDWSDAGYTGEVYPPDIVNDNQQLLCRNGWVVYGTPQDPSDVSTIEGELGCSSEGGGWTPPGGEDGWTPPGGEDGWLPPMS